MYGLHNTIDNQTFFSVFCAYSARNPKGGYDIWKVSLLRGHRISSDVDIDYIRTCQSGDFLGWTGGFGTSGAPVWRETGWVKLRQFFTTTIKNPKDNRTLGLLSINVSAFGEPTPALVEAKKYDSGWHVLGDKESRGTDKVKSDIAEWEDIIRNGRMSPELGSPTPGW